MNQNRQKRIEALANARARIEDLKSKNAILKRMYKEATGHDPPGYWSWLMSDTLPKALEKVEDSIFSKSGFEDFLKGGIRRDER